MSIIISQKGKKAKKINKSEFENEDYLQQYILENPDSIPLYDIDEDLRLLIVAREFSTESGPIDALGVDKEGNLYFIETKLYKNPDKRLVVAQVLDYGASLWRSYSDFNEFLNNLNQHIKKAHNTSFEERVQEFFEIQEKELEEFTEKLQQNLDAGNYRFVVLMDKLHDRLKDLVIFLNENSKFDIFAVELEYYKHEDYEIVIPKLFGAQVKKDVSRGASGPRKKWDEERFFEVLQKQANLEQCKVVKSFYEFVKNEGAEISWGTGVNQGSFNVIFEDICRRSVCTVWTNGNLEINFNWLNGSEEIEKFRDELREKLEKELQFEVDENYKRGRNDYAVEKWTPEVEKLKSIIIELVRKYSN